MEGRFLTEERILEFKTHLISEEKSMNTIEKYIRDVRAFSAFLSGRENTKELVVSYKQKLLETKYAVKSINSMLASINNCFSFFCWNDCKVKSIKQQRPIFCSEEKELTKMEYFRLVNTAEKKKDRRLSLIIQTICGTGIRVSELQFITVESAKTGHTTVNCKGKMRTVFIVKKLKKKLLQYAKDKHITTGPIFTSRGGKPIGRTTIWRAMKSLCKDANVNPNKVFPHNLRHLFARTFYEMERDIAKLADVLGHNSINTTRIYIISTGTEHQRYMERLRLIL